MKCRTVRTYDVKVDEKNRLTLKRTMFKNFHVEEYPDGRIVLEPREVTSPFLFSEKFFSKESFAGIFRKGKAAKKMTAEK